MKNPKVLFQAAVVLVALMILGLTGWVVVGSRTDLLPWAGFLAGLVALLHAGTLDGLVRPIRVALAVAGVGAMVFMAVVALAGG